MKNNILLILSGISLGLFALFVVFLGGIWIYDAEAMSCMEAPDDLVSWWSGNGDFSDAHGEYDGVGHNGAGFAPGKVGDAINLDGVDDYVSIAPSPDLTGPYTIEGWVYLPDVVGNRMLLTQLDVTPGNMQAALAFWFHGNNIRGTVYDNAECIHDTKGCNSYRMRIATGVLTPGFHHVGMTYDGGDSTAAIALYLDGVRVDDSGLSGGAFTSVKPVVTDLRIGTVIDTDALPSNFFGGLVDELMLHNRMLASSEIVEIFHTDSAGICAKNSYDPLYLNIHTAKLTNDDHFHIKGDLAADSQDSTFDLLHDEVTVMLDGFSETILPGAFTEDGGGKVFMYNPHGVGGISEMRVHANGSFDIHARGADLTGIHRGVAVPFSIEIGNFKGETAIVFNERSGLYRE